MSNFRVGQKVVCVDDEGQSLLGAKDVFRGEVYVISWVGEYGQPEFGMPFMTCVRLEGVDRYCPSVGDDVPLRASRFRPAVERKTDISIFKAMLEDKKATADA